VREPERGAHHRRNHENPGQGVGRGPALPVSGVRRRRQGENRQRHAGRGKGSGTQLFAGLCDSRQRQKQGRGVGIHPVYGRDAGTDGHDENQYHGAQSNQPGERRRVSEGHVQLRAGQQAGRGEHGGHRHGRRLVLCGGWRVDQRLVQHPEHQGARRQHDAGSVFLRLDRAEHRQAPEEVYLQEIQ